MKHLATVLLLCVFLITCAYGDVLHVENGIYIGETANNIPNGYGVFHSHDEQYEYVGNFIDGYSYALF